MFPLLVHPPNDNKQPGLGQAEARSRELRPVHHTGVGNQALGQASAVCLGAMSK